MRIGILLSIALLCQLNSALAVNKCVGMDGKVTFQDGTCPTSAVSKEEIHVRPQGTVSGAALMGTVGLDFSGLSQEQKFMKALAAVETLADLSDDCKIKIQVYGSKPEAMLPCQAFSKQQAAWGPVAFETMHELTSDPTWVSNNASVISRIDRSRRRLMTNNEYIAARLRADTQR